MNISSTNNISFGAYTRIGRNNDEKRLIAQNISQLPPERQNAIIKSLNNLAYILAVKVSDDHSLAINYKSFPDDFRSHLVSVVDLDKPNYEEYDILFDKEVTDTSLKEFFDSIKSKYIEKFQGKKPADQQDPASIFDKLV